MAALQPAAGVDGVGEVRIPGRRAAQVPDRQRASVDGGGSNGAAGETAEDTTEGAAVCGTRVSGADLGGGKHPLEQ